MFKMCASNYALCFIGKILLFVNIQVYRGKDNGKFLEQTTDRGKD